MSTSQSAFRDALLDPGAAVPAGLVDGAGRPAGKRFDVYRNNVVVSLTEALEVAFPVVRKLVGDEFFRSMAGVYLRENLPDSPVLMFYGATFPRFLRNFRPVGHLPYLPDVARLEIAIRISYHAADSTAIDPAAFQALAPEALMQARLELAPSAVLVRGRWPVFGIWRYNMVEGAPQPPGEPQDVLVTRADFDPAPQLLPRAGADFFEALQAGATFGAALGRAKAIDHRFDLAATLAVMISGGVFTKIIEE